MANSYGAFHSGGRQYECRSEKKDGNGVTKTKKGSEFRHVERVSKVMYGVKRVSGNLQFTEADDVL